MAQAHRRSDQRHAGQARTPLAPRAASLCREQGRRRSPDLPLAVQAGGEAGARSQELSEEGRGSARASPRSRRSTTAQPKGSDDQRTMEVDASERGSNGSGRREKDAHAGPPPTGRNQMTETRPKLYKIEEPEASREVLRLAGIPSHGAGTPHFVGPPWPARIDWREEVRKIEV